MSERKVRDDFVGAPLRQRGLAEVPQHGADAELFVETVTEAAPEASILLDRHDLPRVSCEDCGQHALPRPELVNERWRRQASRGDDALRDRVVSEPVLRERRGEG